MIDEKKIEQEQLLEMYRIYVDAALRMTVQRSKTNVFFISVLTALIGVIGLFFKNENNFTENISSLYLVCVSAVGVAICILWVHLIEAFRENSIKKFNIIHDMERLLPYKCFEMEWASKVTTMTPDVAKAVNIDKDWNLDGSHFDYRIYNKSENVEKKSSLQKIKDFLNGKKIGTSDNNKKNTSVTILEIRMAQFFIVIFSCLFAASIYSLYD